MAQNLTSAQRRKLRRDHALIEWTDKACSDAKSGYFNKVPDNILSLLKNGQSIQISCDVGRTWLDIQAMGITREHVGECERYGPTGLKCLFGTCGGKLYSAWTNASWHGVTRVR